MDKKLRAAQLKMVVVLDEIDRICRANNIGYWLDAGTLLGAKRHGGFIPWDDDIDICMKRGDYKKFLAACNVHLNKDEYFLQTAESDKYYIDYNTPCKIRMNNTTIIEQNEIKHNYYDARSHHGLFVDIFPYDKYSKNKYVRKYIERIISQLFKVKVISKYSNLSLSKKIFSKLIGGILNKKLMLTMVDILSQKMDKKVDKYLLGAGIETPFFRAYYREETIFPLKEIEFEGKKYKCPNDVDGYLDMMFGKNHMRIPPVNQRVWHYHHIDIS